MEISFIEIIRSIAELGFMTISAALIIYLFIKQNKKAEEDSAEREQRLAKQQDETSLRYNNLVDSIVTKVTNHTISPEEDRILSIIERNINKILNDTLGRIDANRVALIRYHNGGRGTNGYSFLKMSMTNEVVSVETPPFMPEFQNQFRSLLAYWCDHIDTNNSCFLPDINEVKDLDSTMYEFMKSRNVRGMFGMSINDKYNRTIGFILVEFLGQQNKELDIKKITDILNQVKPKIEALLNLDV